MKLMQTQFLSFWGVNSNDELTGLIQTQAKSFSDRVQTVVNGLTEEAKNGKTAEMVRGFTDRVTSQINDLKNKNPELFTEAQKYQVIIAVCSTKHIQNVLITNDYTGKLPKRHEGHCGRNAKV